MAIGGWVDDRIHLVHVGADPLQPHAEHRSKDYDSCKAKECQTGSLQRIFYSPFVLVLSVSVGSLI